MSPVLVSGLLYAGLTFAAGFVLGAARNVLIAPFTGPLLAVCIELPIMLAFSWYACRQSLRRVPVAPKPAPRLAMGAVALIALLGLEALLSLTLGGLTPAQHLALYGTAPVLTGLAGQVIFALFPLARIGSDRA
ncbi:MAG: hypothetical protein JNM45_00770 [Rhizobiales bacterium]|nr:hypothetical protein [Hyphomicrobiales bacterium]